MLSGHSRGREPNWAVILNDSSISRSCKEVKAFVVNELQGGGAGLMASTSGSNFYRNVFKELVERIFGGRNTENSWIVMTQSKNSANWKAIVDLLGIGETSMFVALAELQTSIQYPFPVAALPRHLQELIMYSRQHPTRDFFNLLSEPRPTASELLLSPMEYYLFSYVHFAVSIWRQSDRDRAYLSDMRSRSSRQLISEMSGTTIQSRGSSLDSVTIPQLRDQNIYIDLLVQYLICLMPHENMNDRGRVMSEYSIVLISLMIEFWLEQNERLKLPQLDQQQYSQIRGGDRGGVSLVRTRRGGSRSSSKTNRSRRRMMDNFQVPFVNPTQCQIESILTLMTYLLADPALGRVMVTSQRDGRAELPGALREVQLPLFEFFANVLTNMPISNSAGLADHQHRFGAVVDVWYSCVLQPWTAHARLREKKGFVQTQESSSQKRRAGLMTSTATNFLTNQSVITNRRGFNDQWHNYIVYNYIFYAPLLLRFLRRASTDFNFKNTETAHFDLIWEVLQFFSSDHTRPSEMWRVIRKASASLTPLLSDFNGTTRGQLEPHLRDRLMLQCKIVFQQDMMNDSRVYDTLDDAWTAWVHECMFDMFRCWSASFFLSFSHT